MDREGRIVSEQGWQLSAAQQILDSPKEGWVGGCHWVGGQGQLTAERRVWGQGRVFPRFFSAMLTISLHLFLCYII